MTSTDARMSDSNPGAISSFNNRWTCSSVRTSCHTLRPSLASLVIASLSSTSTDWPSAAVITSLPSAPAVKVTCPDISRAAAAAAIAESWSTPAAVARSYASASMASASASFLFCSACCCWSVLSTSLSRVTMRCTVPWIPSSAPLSPAWERSCVHTSFATSAEGARHLTGALARELLHHAEHSAGHVASLRTIGEGWVSSVGSRRGFDRRRGRSGKTGGAGDASRPATGSPIVVSVLVIWGGSSPSPCVPRTRSCSQGTSWSCP